MRAGFRISCSCPCLPLPVAALFCTCLPCFGPGWLDWFLAGPPPALIRVGFRSQHAMEDMHLRKAEVQYVLPKCRFDNRTVDLLRPSPPARLTRPPCFDAT